MFFFGGGGGGGGGQQFVTQYQVNMFTAKSQNLCFAPVGGFKTFVAHLMNVMFRYFILIINGFESIDQQRADQDIGT